MVDREQMDPDVERVDPDTEEIDLEAEAEESFDDLLARALTILPENVRELAAQAIVAARRVHENGQAYLDALVNMRPVESDDGTVAVRMDVTPNALNGAGYVHGGMLFALAEDAMATAGVALLDAGHRAVMREVTATCLGNVREGHMIARSEAVQRHKDVIVLETRIHDADSDELLMTVTGTFAVIEDGDARAHGDGPA